MGQITSYQALQLHSDQFRPSGNKSIYWRTLETRLIETLRGITPRIIQENKLQQLNHKYKLLLDACTKELHILPQLRLYTSNRVIIFYDFLLEVFLT